MVLSYGLVRLERTHVIPMYYGISGAQRHEFPELAFLRACLHGVGLSQDGSSGLRKGDKVEVPSLSCGILLHPPPVSSYVEYLLGLYWGPLG